MKYAIIGTGYWGSNHVRVAAELAERGTVDEVVLCDIDEGRVSELSASFGLDYTTDINELGKIGVDAATVATPSDTHAEIATGLLHDGIDLLIEKPLALSSENAWDIVETASETGRTLAVGHIFRFHPALCELKERVERGELGRLKYLNSNRFSFRVPRETTGVLYSLAVHDVDIYSFLLDRSPIEVYCNMDAVMREGVDETTTIVFEYGEATGVINSSWQVPVFGKRRDLTVIGSERAAHIDYLEDTVLEIYEANVVRGPDGLRATEDGVHRYEVDSGEPLRIEVEHFIDCCQSGETPRASGEVGAKTVELLELARRSSDEGRIIDVASSLENPS
jgi:predicted dehydrogenase